MTQIRSEEASAPRPQQARSRQSLAAIVQATRAVLAEKGHERLTIPEVVARAGCSVGCLYGRFANKEALLSYVSQHFFAEAEAGWQQFLDPARWEGAPALQIIEEMVRSAVACTRADEALLRAFTLYWQTAELDAGAREAAARHYQGLFERLAELLLARRQEISHPQPELAIKFAVEWMDAAITERLLLNTYRLSQVTMTDEQLVRELTRALAGYLGITSPVSEHS
jgi:AcrR family transcriptional regulator